MPPPATTRPCGCGTGSPAPAPPSPTRRPTWPSPRTGPGSPAPAKTGPCGSVTKDDFSYDWDTLSATCPRGVTSPPWKPARADGHPRWSVLFPKPACRVCDDRVRCTGDTAGRGRHLTLMPQPLHEIQSRTRKDQDTETWQRHYALRTGCEATISETVRAHGLRRCRYRGRAKTHVQHVLTAVGTNIARLSESTSPGIWDTRTPRSPTRFRRFCERHLMHHPR
ncbi:transposase [Streptodolium elevatio]